MRHEKELLARPMPPCPDIPQIKNRKIDAYRTRVFRRYTAELAEFGEDKALGVTTYTEAGEPKYRFWTMGDKRGLEVVNNEYCGANLREHGKMYGAAIDSCYAELSSSWTSREIVFYSTAEDADRVLRFLGVSAPRKDAFALLVEKQKGDRAAVIERRDEREREALRKAFEGIPCGASVEFESWCEDVAMKDFRWFFYEYTGRREQSGVCSYCGHRASLTGIRHGKRGTCPACRSLVTFYSAKRFKNSNGLGGRIHAAQCVPMEGKVVVRRFTVGLELQGSPRSDRVFEKRVWASENGRSFLDPLSGREIACYEPPSGTRKVYVDGLCRTEVLGGAGEHALMPSGVRAIREAMGIYAPLEELAKRGGKVDPVAVWRLAKESGAAEYLIKLGLYRLAENELRTRWPTTKVLLEGKTAPEVLGVSGEVVQMLRRIDPGAKAVKVIRALLKCGAELTEQDMRDIDELSIEPACAGLLHRMMDYATAHKVLRYLAQQVEKGKMDASHMIHRWGDYAGMAQELGKNFASLQVVFPKDLNAAHDEAVKLQRAKKNKELSRGVGKTAKKLQHLCWKWGGLVIRPAASHEELFAEGEALDHCVGRMNYAEKMAQGRTAIFFIRKAAEQNTPYVTLELDLKKWEKIQCYGKRDRWAGEAVDNFVKKWIKDVVKPAAAAKSA